MTLTPSMSSPTSSETFESEDDYIHRAIVTSDRNHERITNEAKALKLVLQQTSVPVPRLLDYGTYPDGRRYLTTEFIEGSRLDTFPARHCSKPEGQKHTIGTPCKDCSGQAYANALEFISSTPRHPASVDREGMLEDSASKLPEYVFQHGDIAAQNIIMDSQTLQVKALIDLEYAGFYPPQMENWPGTLCPDTYNRHGEKIGHLRRRFLATEYLKCYDKWSNKAELHELIDRGQLPHPDQMKQDSTWG
ncbi:hypothetical protein IAQ61_009783 [Plenodomus lingam]|uniref:uncharacterized protein n=1 Tax=Leptosphaeria maculans TaxID=5022 RepID=UPI00332EF55C|nr:hypothetical protein IAQ61_009783 [Plenodomus lingam]